MSAQRFTQPNLAMISTMLVAVSTLTTCTRASEGSVLLDLSSFAKPDLPGLRQVDAVLVVTHRNGTPASLFVTDPATSDIHFVTSPVPMACFDGSCELNFTIDPGDYQVALDVFARDRCGARAQIATALPTTGNPVSLQGFTPLQLDDVSFAFDDDQDGIENVLEPLGCGRFDFDDADGAPQNCADPDDPCCATWPGKSIVGRMARFAGGSHVRADESVVDVTPFSLDATEVTWENFARCVTAGACLFGVPEHPVRQALVDAPRGHPVTGVTPNEAQNYCAWAGKRLPLDDEWDFAAAHADGNRRRWPFDPSNAPSLVGRATDPGGRAADDDDVLCFPSTEHVAFNHRSAGAACPGAPRDVGSYPTSYNWDGDGAPLADMAGNVFEWTVDDIDDGVPSLGIVPAGVTTLRLRGGHFLSGRTLVDNDLAIALTVVEDDAMKVKIAGLLSVTGFRCASPAVLPHISEPSCPVVDDFIVGDERSNGPADDPSGESPRNDDDESSRDE